MRRIQRGSCSLLIICKPSSEVYLFISYHVSGGLIDAKVDHVMPCFNIIIKKHGFSFDNVSNFEFIFKPYSN